MQTYQKYVQKDSDTIIWEGEGEMVRESSLQYEHFEAYLVAAARLMA
jgi:hypothetical protein